MAFTPDGTLVHQSREAHFSCVICLVWTDIVRDPNTLSKFALDEPGSFEGYRCYKVCRTGRVLDQRPFPREFAFQSHHHKVNIEPWSRPRKFFELTDCAMQGIAVKRNEIHRKYSIQKFAKRAILSRPNIVQREVFDCAWFSFSREIIPNLFPQTGATKPSRLHFRINRIAKNCSIIVAVGMICVLSVATSYK
jgi:hypothetical protein